jgi:tetratricopeptide (TPR) repeat protein
MKRAAVFLLVVFTCLASGITRAEARPSRNDYRLAAKHRRKALGLARKGKHKKAAKAYKKADRLVPSLANKLGRAEQLAKAGNLVKAGELLKKAVKLPARKWRDKQTMRRIRKLAEDVEERVPTLRIKVRGPDSDDFAVTVDDEEFEVGDGAVNFNPGRYEVVVKAKGFKTYRREIKLAEGDVEKLVIRLKLVAVPKDEEEESDGEGMSRVPAYLCWGVGVAGLGLGVGFGIAAMNATNDVLTLYGCQNDKCPPEAEADLSVAKTNGNISTAGFVVGGAGLVAGTVLFFVAGKDKKEDDDEAAKGRFSMEARPLVGPGFVGVQGRF